VRSSSVLDPELSDHWRRPPGIFVIAEVEGIAGAHIREVQRRFDPKLANALPPHVTVVGSSGIGPFNAEYSAAELRERLAPICREIAPMAVELEPPHRFMQTNIVVLPIDPHGPIRQLHEAIAASGLRHARARFTFTPHVTLSFHRTLTPESLRELLAVRIDEPVHITSIRCSLTDEPMPPRTLLELHLGA
jgi:2'-5' RNA ligase